jgi:DNA-binding transcriptional LysR family regulator
MNERQLRYALAVRDERGFSRAAKRLCVSQPSISQQIKLLEDELGFALFLRTKSDVDITFLGRKFLSQAEQALTGFNGLHDVARQLRHGASNTLALGVSSGISPFVVPLAIEALTPVLEKTRIEMTSAPSPRIQQLVLQEVLGLGIVVEIHARRILPELRRDCLGTIDMALFVAPSHPWAQRRTAIDLAEMTGERLITTEPRTGYGELVQCMFTDRRLQPNIVAISDRVGIAKFMVRAGIGDAILPAVCAPDEIRGGQLVCLPIHNAPCVSIDLVQSPAVGDRTPTTAAAAIAALLRKRLATNPAKRNVA